MIRTCLVVALVCFFTPIAMAQNELKLSQELSAIVQQQVQDWNRGNIEGFMQAYWKSEQLTFSSGGKTVRGWKATRDRYLRRYPDRKAMGKLVFSELEVQSLGEDAAIMLGRWKLELDQPIGGNFTLVWRRLDSQWLIVHDHTSKQETLAQ